MKSKRNFNLFYSIRNFFICKVTVCFLCVIAVCMIPLIKTVNAHAYGGVIDDDPTLVKFDFSGYSSQFPTHDVSNTDSINGILTFHPYSVFFGDENSAIQYFSDRKA